MSLKAVFNNIIVKPLEEEETTYGSIVIPDLGKEKSLVGTIVSVGDGYWSVTGNFIKTSLEVDQKVYLPAILKLNLKVKNIGHVKSHRFLPL